MFKNPLLILFVLFIGYRCKSNVENHFQLQKNNISQNYFKGRDIDTVKYMDKKVDSMQIIQTIREYGKLNWYTYRDYSHLYDVSNDKLNIFINRIFYSPENKRIIVWIGIEMNNVNKINNFDENLKSDKICPSAGEKVYHFSVLIGYKSNNNWRLYPWGNRQVPCCNSILEGEIELEKYYFKEIKADYFETVIQKGKEKGKIVQEKYKYSITNEKFWTRSLLWQKDTVGANNLYPFEVKSYGGGMIEKCFKCAEPFILPYIN